MKPYTWKEAFEDALEAAKRGKPEYQTFVGYCFDIGKGVKCDPKMAKYWYTKAARNGNSDAIFNLALSYDHGSEPRSSKEPSPCCSTVSTSCTKGPSSVANKSCCNIAGREWQERLCRRCPLDEKSCAEGRRPGSIQSRTILRLRRGWSPEECRIGQEMVVQSAKTGSFESSPPAQLEILERSLKNVN